VNPWYAGLLRFKMVATSNYVIETVIPTYGVTILSAFTSVQRIKASKTLPSFPSPHPTPPPLDTFSILSLAKPSHLFTSATPPFSISQTSKTHLHSATPLLSIPLIGNFS